MYGVRNRVPRIRENRTDPDPFGKIFTDPDPKRIRPISKNYYFYLNQGCADPGKSYGSGFFSTNFYGSGSETDPTNFKKFLWYPIKSKYFQGQTLQ